MSISNNGKPLEYEIHEPSQNAYGDWTLLKSGVTIIFLVTTIQPITTNR